MYYSTSIYDFTYYYIDITGYMGTMTIITVTWYNSFSILYQPNSILVLSILFESHRLMTIEFFFFVLACYILIEVASLSMDISPIPILPTPCSPQFCQELIIIQYALPPFPVSSSSPSNPHPMIFVACKPKGFPPSGCSYTPCLCP